MHCRPGYMQRRTLGASALFALSSAAFAFFMADTAWLIFFDRTSAVVALVPRAIGDRRSVLAGDGSGPGLGRQRWLKVERRQLVPQHLDLFRKPVELLRRDPHVAQLLLGGSQPMKRVEELVRLVRVFIGEQLSQRLVTSIVFGI